MTLSRFGIVGLVLAAGLGLSACASDGYYGGASIGYGGGYYSDPYYDSYYGGYGYPSYYGWYGDYYYPGTGIYVYDRYRRPHRWSDSQRRYWSRRVANYQRAHRDWRGDRKGNWAGWNRTNRGNASTPNRWRGRATPRAGTPRAGTPRAGTPRTGTPRARPPRAGTPRAGTPRARPPRATTGQRGTTTSRSSRPSRPAYSRGGGGRRHR